MAQTIKLKRSATSGAEPSTSDLALGELGLNTYDGKIFMKKNDGSDAIVEVGGGGGARFDSDTLAANTTLDALTHYLEGKDTIINNGVTLTIPADTLLEIRTYIAGKTL
jgi:hypothetical protein